MNSNRTILAAVGVVVLLAGHTALAQTATVSRIGEVVAHPLVAKAQGVVAVTVPGPSGHFSDAVFNRPASAGAGAGATSAKATASPGVVVTYANNRSSVVVTGHRFDVDRDVGGAASTMQRSQ